MTLPPVAILVGGLATRMYPLTETIPKALLDVAGKPFIHHQLDLLQRSGISRVVLCVGYLGEMIEREVGDGSRFGLNVAYSYDGDVLLGTGGALRRALPLLDAHFFVTYGDGYLETDYGAIATQFAVSGKRGLMVVYRNQDAFDASNVVYRDGQIVTYDKVNRSAEMAHIDYGVGMLRRELLTVYPAGTRFDLADVYGALVSAGEMAGYENPTRFYEIGSQEGLAETDAYLRGRLEG